MERKRQAEAREEQKRGIGGGTRGMKSGNAGKLIMNRQVARLKGRHFSQIWK